MRDELCQIFQVANGYIVLTEERYLEDYPRYNKNGDLVNTEKRERVKPREMVFRQLDDALAWIAHLTHCRRNNA